MTLSMADPWYKDGLRFKCTECGKCCTGAPGYVFVTDPEIESMAAYLKMSPRQFAIRFLRRVDGRQSLVEYSKSYDCIFLKDNKCSIYPVRPKQCKTFPWWISNLKSPAAWNEAAKTCEGINPEAPLVSYETIQQSV